MTNEDISMSKRVIIIPNIGWIDWKALCRKMIWNTLYQCSDKIVYFYQSTSEKIMVICKMEIIHKIFIWFTKKSSSEKEGKHLRFSQYKPLWNQARNEFSNRRRSSKLKNGIKTGIIRWTEFMKYFWPRKKAILCKLQYDMILKFTYILSCHQVPSLQVFFFLFSSNSIKIVLFFCCWLDVPHLNNFKQSN